MEARQIYAVVRGRVQGVSFRLYTQREAERLSLAGTVRNLDDGGVEVLAEGPVSSLEALIAWLAHGPPFARVDRLHWEWTEAHDLPRRFTIR